MKRPDVSAVVVAWNSGALLQACVDSLRTSARAGSISLQLVVVDNDSVDGSVEGLALEPGDLLVRNRLNAGFGVAAAQGTAVAEAPWLLLVNPDVRVDVEFLGNLVQTARAAPENVATLTPELRYAAEPLLVNCRGVTTDVAGIPREVDAGLSHEEPASTCDVMGGTSGCCLLRKAALLALGGIEPCYFAYLEDVDLALRLQRAGYGATFVPEALAWHVGSVGIGEGSPLKTYLVARNRRVLFRLHGPRTTSARVWRLVIETAHGVVSSLGGDALAPWAGRLSALRLRRYTRFLLRSRRLLEPPREKPRLAARATLRTTLERKRRLSGSMYGH